MTDISAFTIVRNEELLIAKHLTELGRHASEVVCIVQPSTDGTTLFARSVAEQMTALGLRCRIVEHEPTRLGKEFSVPFALEQCAFDWCFNLDADETYLGRPLGAVLAAAPTRLAAVSIVHFQAVGCTGETWFKADPMQPRVRLVHRRRVPLTIPFDLHVGLDALVGHPAVAHLPASEGRILEYKAAWQHYVDQLFYEAAGTTEHEARECRAMMPPQALELGETAFRIDRRGRRPVPASKEG